MKRRLPTILCALYALLVLYGSLMPFDFVNDPPFVAKKLHDFWLSWPLSDEIPTSKPDMIANVLLYMPLGWLIVTARIVRRGRSRVAAVLLAYAIGMALSITVEMLQAYELTRDSSVNDVFTNSTGSLAGGVLALMIGRAVWIAWHRRLRKVWADRPIVMAAAVVMLLWVIDAFYPFLPTVDVGELRLSAKLCVQHWGAAGLAAHPWHYWLVERIGMCAAVSVLLACVFRVQGRPRWMLGAVAAIVFTAATEVGKTFISSRFCNPANIAMSACGAVAGVILGRVLAGLSWRSKVRLAILGTLCYVVYLEWAPFNWVWDAAAMGKKLTWGPEWLPLYPYAMQGRGEKTAGLVQSLAILGTLAYLMQMARTGLGLAGGEGPGETHPHPALCAKLSRGGRGVDSAGKWRRACRAAAVTGLLAVVLQLGLFLLPDRVPSTNDVFCFAVGGALGSLLASAHQARKKGPWRVGEAAPPVMYPNVFVPGEPFPPPPARLVGRAGIIKPSDDRPAAPPRPNPPKDRPPQ